MQPKIVKYECRGCPDNCKVRFKSLFGHCVPSSCILGDATEAKWQWRGEKDLVIKIPKKKKVAYCDSCHKPMTLTTEDNKCSCGGNFAYYGKVKK